MTSFEDQLTETFARNADDAPKPGGLLEASSAQHRRRRSRRIGASISVGVLVALATGGSAHKQGPTALTDDSPIVAQSESGSAPSPGTTSGPATRTGLPSCGELLASPSLLAVDPVAPVPDDEAEHITYNSSGTVAAWFRESGPLPELFVFDLASGRQLAYEDLGVGDVATDPSARIYGQSLCYRTAVDPNIWLRYAWATDDFPLAYLNCDATGARGPRPLG